jgi:hypothetical protein
MDTFTNLKTPAPTEENRHGVPGLRRFPGNSGYPVGLSPVSGFITFLLNQNT